MPLISVTELLGGWPFLDVEFSPNRLMAAVACSRQLLSSHEGDVNVIPISAFLSPELGDRIRNLQGSNLLRQSEGLSKQQEAAICKSENRIIQRVSNWLPLMRLPRRYRRMVRTGVISCSCFAHPQTVFLSNEAFRSDEELDEQIVHELCHVWSYLIEEVMPFHCDPCEATFTLPSGTSGKNATEVLGAAYVGAVLYTWYLASDDNCDPVGRKEELRAYIEGCLAIVYNVSGYSESGYELITRLKFFLDCALQKNEER
jgi:hypothetical protein